MGWFLEDGMPLERTDAKPSRPIRHHLPALSLSLDVDSGDECT